MKKITLLFLFIALSSFAFVPKIIHLINEKRPHLETEKIAQQNVSKKMYDILAVNDIYTEDFEGTHGWEFLNGTQTNKWSVGTAVNNGGTKSLYISDNNGVSNNYNVSAASVTQAFKLITLPSNTVDVEIQFDWRSVGETGLYDYFRVWVVPEAYVPTPGTQITNGGGRVRVGGDFYQGSVFTTNSSIVNLSALAGQNIKLVFEWRNDGILGTQPPAAIDNILVKRVVCSAPTGITVSGQTTDSAVLTWTAPTGSSVTGYDYYISPVNTVTPGTTPTGNTTNTTVTVGNLAQAVTYYFWVRTNCGAVDGTSVWQGPMAVNALISNDNCPDAITVPVNDGIECVETVPGTVIGATPSATGTVCAGTPANDVWFEFTAEAPTHMIRLLNMSITYATTYIVVYQGEDCTTAMANIGCVTGQALTLNNLAIGQIYKIRIYTSSFYNTLNFDVCVTTPTPPIKVDDTQYTVPELVTDVLIDNDCANISNITWSTGTNFGTVNGIGYFEQNGSSFPFGDGIILSTGNFASAPGPKGLGVQGAGGSVWGGDTDLTNVLTQQGITGPLLNATKLEFDFVAITNQISFNFIFASEEYGTFQCNYSDAFAFLLTDLATNTTTNLAVVPNTNIPVSVTTIRNNAYNGGCASVNPEYFAEYYNGTNSASMNAPINFRGYTVPLIAQSQVVPGQTYHIKLVIADFGGSGFPDSSYDSAVFLEGGSFDLGSVNIGDNRLIDEGTALCYGESVLLDSQLNPDNYTIEWFKNGVLIPGANGTILEVNESGEYKIEATFIGSTCAINDSIIIEIYPELTVTVPDNIEICIFRNQIPMVDLTVNEDQLLSQFGDTSQLIVGYYENIEDAEDVEEQIVSPENYQPIQLPQQIFVRVEDDLGCYKIVSFRIIRKPIIDLKKPDDIITCVYNEVASIVDLTSIEAAIISDINNNNVTITYYESESEAINEVSPISGATAYQPYNLPQTIYISLIDNETGCQSVSSFQIIASEELMPFEADDIVSCTNYVLPELPQGQFYSSEEFGKGELYESGKIFSLGKYTVFINIKNEDNCAFSSSYSVEVINCSVPKGISPNGDGLNDSFDLTYYHPLAVAIYNRDGREVYSYGNGYTNQWYGQSKNGKELPDGTYYYKITTTTEVLTGYVQIAREIK